MLIPDEIAVKQGKLSPEEWHSIKQHPQAGFDLLCRMHGSHIIPVALMVLEHHENCDGSGYPFGKKQIELSQCARILAVANIYDALVADRPFRLGYGSDEACRIMKNMSGRFLDPEILNAFIQCIAVYPYGSIVRLNSGEVGVVTHVPYDAPMRPQVRVFMSKQGGILKNDWNVDLSLDKQYDIQCLLPENAIIPISHLYMKKRG